MPKGERRQARSPAQKAGEHEPRPRMSGSERDVTKASWFG